MTRRRFERRKWWRLIDRLIEEVDYFNPNHLTDDDLLHMTREQRYRALNRIGDCTEVAERALLLRDALTTFR